MLLFLLVQSVRFILSRIAGGLKFCLQPLLFGHMLLFLLVQSVRFILNRIAGGLKFCLQPLLFSSMLSFLLVQSVLEVCDAGRTQSIVRLGSSNSTAGSAAPTRKPTKRSQNGVSIPAFP